MARISTFDDWVDMFNQWRTEMGVDHPYIKNYQFEVKFSNLETDEVEFGAFKGRKKWERVSQIPDQRMRDALLNYIVYQGDTEFASVEQQRFLFNTAPSEYDAASLARIMTEEMRHGWQMSHLLLTYFGDSGKLEAQKLLERRAFQKNRLLGSFNGDTENWLDLFIYTQFIDRDGKFQLGMLRHSGFAPLARSMGPMLKEESYHLGTGNNGILRIVRAGVVPIPLIQKYINKWVPTAYDLFGTDHSGSAHWAYTWGLKGRYDEGENPQPADLDFMNEYARSLYINECQALLERINRVIPEEQPKLFLPNLKFNRRIGDFANHPYDLKGNLLPAEEFHSYLETQLPSAADKEVLKSMLKGSDWIVERELKTGV